MNNYLNCPKYKVYCDRYIIFKKYNKEISHLVRLDFNIDILPKEKGYFYPDKNGDICQDVYYIDMSTIEFVIYNEDLKMCGNYDYNNEELHYYTLPLNERKYNKKLDKKTTNDDNQEIVVRAFKFRGKKYLKDNIGIVYDYNEYVNSGNQVVVGQCYGSSNDIDLFDNEFEEEDIMLKIALTESLTDLKNKDEEQNMLGINKNKNQQNEIISLSGIKAEERILKLQSKYKKTKNIEKNVIYQDDEMRKRLS